MSTPTVQPASSKTVPVSVKADWPILFAATLFFALIVCIAPWSELPVNDDWQYAHVAKTLAQRGTFTVDVPIAPSVVGQSLMAWPVIRTFGFSHLALRLLTLGLSVLILVEIDYLLRLAAVAAGIRFIALCTLVANPLFLHFSTSFMTENYGYFVALLAACVWFAGRERHRLASAALAAAIAGFSFWIRQFSALVFPALVLAEFIAAGGGYRNLRSVVTRHALAIAIWTTIVVAYFLWSSATGNYTAQFSRPLANLLSPSLLVILVELGAFIFYLTFFLAPFLLAYARREKPSIPISLFPLGLILTAGFAWRFGDNEQLPYTSLHAVFPFLHNVFTSYGVGPVTFTDVYLLGSRIRPRVSEIPWVALEVAAIALSVAWGGVIARVRAEKNEIGIFGIAFALLSFVVVVLSSQAAVFDRYHYAGLLGFTIALAAFYPAASERRLRLGALVWLTCLGAFSTLALHDYFRWNEARAQLLTVANQSGIPSSQIDAGYEPNGWNAVENAGPSATCGPVVGFCPDRPYRIGLDQALTDSVIGSRSVNAWLVRFPDVRLLKRR